MTPTRFQSTNHSEGGYALVSLLLVMSLLALFALGAAQNVRQQAQREREKEAIFRGEQVGDAIRSYYRYRGAQGVNSLPNSMDDLLQGIPRGTKKLQILRVEAAHDPLSTSGEWRLVGPTSQDVGAFVKSLTVYSGGVPPTPRGEMARLASLIPQMTNILNAESTKRGIEVQYLVVITRNSRRRNDTMATKKKAAKKAAKKGGKKAAKKR